MSGDFGEWNQDPVDESYTRMPADVARIFLNEERRRRRLRIALRRAFEATVLLAAMAAALWAIFRL